MPRRESVRSIRIAIETETGVVVIDAQRSISPVQKFARQIREIQKPVLAFFLTHPHPDHFGGMSVLAKEFTDTPRYALQITRDGIMSDTGGYIALSQKALGDDFDPAIPLPDRIITSGETLLLSGVRFVAEDAGIGEASCMLMLHLPEQDTLFCADVVQHGMTAFLLEGHLESWRQQLQRVAKKYGGVGTVYPGHGEPGSASELFAYQIAYLDNFQRLLAANRNADGSLQEGGKEKIVGEMNRLYPGYLPVAAIPDLLEQDVDALQKTKP